MASFETPGATGLTPRNFSSDRKQTTSALELQCVVQGCGVIAENDKDLAVELVGPNQKNEKECRKLPKALERRVGGTHV